MNLFNTNHMQTVTECQSIFDFRLPSVIIPDRCKRFRVKCESCNRLLYKLRPYPVPAVRFAAFVLLMQVIYSIFGKLHMSDCLIINLAYRLYFGVYCILFFVCFLSLSLGDE